MAESLRHVLIVGAGVAGVRCAEHLRERGFEGSLTLVHGESGLPYDRPPLSKQVLVNEMADPPTLIDAPRLSELGIELVGGRRAERLSVTDQTVLLEDGSSVGYDRLVLATGSRPRRLPGLTEWEGVEVLRTWEDAVRIHGLLRSASRVAIVGAGLIGSEVASSARELGLDAVMVDAAPEPLSEIVGPQLAAPCRELHADHGVELRCGVGVSTLEGHGRVERVRLTDGSSIEADLVIVGVGAVPDTDWLEGSGLALGDGVHCDEALRAFGVTVWAAGDIACWPSLPVGRKLRVEHWTNAVEQGRHVAAALLSSSPPEPFRGSNYFWSSRYGSMLQFAGTSQADEVEVVEGSVADRRFAAVYRRGDRLVGVFSMNLPRACMRARRLIAQGAPWSARTADAVVS